MTEHAGCAAPQRTKLPDSLEVAAAKRSGSAHYPAVAVSDFGPLGF